MYVYISQSSSPPPPPSLSEMGGKSKNRLLFGKKVALTRGKQAKRRASRGRGEGKLLLEKLESSRGCGETASLGTAGGLSQRRCHTQQKQTSKKKRKSKQIRKAILRCALLGAPKGSSVSNWEISCLFFTCDVWVRNDFRLVRGACTLAPGCFSL